MVFMASRCQKGHFSFGSIAENVVKNSIVPVITVPIN
jgi:nucleotide-binding universal stress UspA family protein